MMKTIIKIIVVLILSVQTISAGRYYDSETSRFLAVDPKADKYPGLTSYNYCINNPLNNIDPDGKEPITVGGTAIATGTAYVAGAIALAATIHTYKIVTDPNYRMSAKTLTVVVGNAASEAVDDVVGFVKGLFSSGEAANEGNTNPWVGPVDGDVNIVDKDGNVIPVKSGEQVAGSEDGSMIQVKDKDGKPTGTRKDGKGHPKQKDPKARKPHGHRVDKRGKPIKDRTGNPHLPINSR